MDKLETEDPAHFVINHSRLI